MGGPFLTREDALDLGVSNTICSGGLHWRRLASRGCDSHQTLLIATFLLLVLDITNKLAHALSLLVFSHLYLAPALITRLRTSSPSESYAQGEAGLGEHRGY